MASRIGVGGGDDRSFRSSEGTRLSAVCQTAMSAGWKAETLDSGEGLDVEGCIVLGYSMTGLSEMVGMWQPSAVV